MTETRIPDSLWTDAEAATFLAIGLQAVDAVVAAGAPFVFIPGVGRRWQPERLRAWVQGSGAIVGDQLAPRRPVGPTHTRPRFGSGYTRGHREDA